MSDHLNAVLNLQSDTPLKMPSNLHLNMQSNVRLCSADAIDAWLRIRSLWGVFSKDSFSTGQCSQPPAVFLLLTLPIPQIDALLKPLGLLLMGSALRSLNPAALSALADRYTVEQRRWAMQTLRSIPSSDSLLLKDCATEYGRRVMLRDHLLSCSHLNGSFAQNLTHSVDQRSGHASAARLSLLRLIDERLSYTSESSSFADDVSLNRVRLSASVWDSLLFGAPSVPTDTEGTAADHACDSSVRSGGQVSGCADPIESALNLQRVMA